MSRRASRPRPATDSPPSANAPRRTDFLAGIAPTEWIADRGRSGSLAPDKRPGLAKALAMLDAELWPRADGTIRPWSLRAARDALTTIELDDQADAARKSSLESS